MADKNYTSINDLIKKNGGSLNYFSPGQTKESEPLIAKQESLKNQVQETVEYEPQKEVSTYVTPRAETIDLPPDLKKFGLQAAPTTKFPTYQNIKLPISDEKIIVGLHAPITTSLRWLATLAVYLLKLAHLQLKIVHGHVVRVIRRE